MLSQKQKKTPWGHFHHLLFPLYYLWPDIVSSSWTVPTADRGSGPHLSLSSGIAPLLPSHDTIPTTNWKGAVAAFGEWTNFRKNRRGARLQMCHWCWCWKESWGMDKWGAGEWKDQWLSNDSTADLRTIRDELPTLKQNWISIANTCSLSNKFPRKPSTKIFKKIKIT